MEGHCDRQGESVLDDIADIIKGTKYEKAFFTPKEADIQEKKKHNAKCGDYGAYVGAPPSHAEKGRSFISHRAPPFSTQTWHRFESRLLCSSATYEYTPPHRHHGLPNG